MKINRIEIQNYRTIDNLSIDFEEYYTAICGKNNSGKSNILRALLNVFGRVRYNERLNYKTDFPLWKNTKDPILIKVLIQLLKDNDVGLIKFLNFFGSERDESSTISGEIEDTKLEILIKIASKSKDSKTEIRIDDFIVDDKYKISEIMRRINNSQVLIYHNSTQTNPVYRRSPHGQLENINASSKTLIQSKVKAIQNELSKVGDKHKQDLQELLGRLEEKYEVGLSFASYDVDLDEIPYEINLGEKTYALPLDD